MDIYSSFYKSLYRVFHPINRKMRLKQALISDLGKGRPNRAGRALFSYVTDFIQHITDQGASSVWDRDDLALILEKAYQGKFTWHSSHWDSVEIVRQLIERGFVVDCIYDRNGYLLEDVSDYDLILDEWTNLPKWATQNTYARKWFYAATSHWLYNNTAEMIRLQWLFKRRGAEVPPSYVFPPILGPGNADIVTFMGSDFTAKQYGIYKPKLRQLWGTSPVNSSDFKPKDWSFVKKRFLYFGSKGWVHRGLDLVLEAFLKTDLDLYICGSDDGFLDVYGNEIKKRSNIHYLGFIYPKSETYKQIMDTTCAIVYPSAAESCSASVLQCLHFGLIPVVTEATGLSVHADWPPLDGNTDQQLIENILQRCTEISELPDQQIDELSYAFWEYANRNHTRQTYRDSLSRVLDELLG